MRDTAQGIVSPRYMSQSYLETFVFEQTGEHVRLDRIPDRIVLLIAKAVATKVDGLNNDTAFEDRDF
jgi:hypothetical protein